ncbi:helix-turn-helix domain-containing protein [Jatrophihabitans sp. YIM 134969]
MEIDGLVEQARKGAATPAAAAQTIGHFIREQREAAQVSVRQLAQRAGVSNPYLSQIERGLRKPSAEILQQIAHGLSISAEQLYTRAGLLETRSPTDVTAAILADASLSERHKHVLVEIYESFRRESADTTPSPRTTESDDLVGEE